MQLKDIQYEERKRMIVVKEDCIDSMPFGYDFKEEVVVEEVIEEVIE